MITSTANPSKHIQTNELIERCLGNIDLAKNLLDMFAGNLLTELKTMRVHAAKQDALTLSSQAHRLKGSAASVSVTSVSDLAGRIEQAVTQGRILEIGPDISELESIASSFLSEYSEHQIQFPCED